jgi:hypothetical protein
VKVKLPRARVVTGDGPILGAVRQLWTDATESVAECLRAAAEAELARRNPPAEKPAPVLSHVETPAVSLRDTLPTRIMYAINESMHRNGVQRKVIGTYRSEAYCTTVFRVVHLACGRTSFDVRIDDRWFVAWEPYDLVSRIAERIIHDPCPTCARRAEQAALPVTVVLGED